MWNQEKLYGIYRQASGVTPKYIPLSEKYIEAENKYREIRTNTIALSKHLEELKTYEHGGPTYKAILEGFQKVKGKTKVNVDDDLSDNIYNVGENIFTPLSKNHLKKENRAYAEKLVSLSKIMHSKKHEFNKKLGDLIKIIKLLIKTTTEIDDERTKLKNIQFRTEKVYENKKKVDPNADLKADEEIKRMVDMFNVLEGKCENLMNDFLNDAKHKEILNGLIMAYENLHMDVVSEMKK